MSRKITLVALTTIALLGCQNSDSGEPAVQGMAPTSATPVGAQTSMKVNEGPAPLTYLFAAGGNVRIMDTTEGRRVTSAKVAPQTFLRIDQAKGIYAGEKRLERGPLPEGHNYEIWLDR